MTLDQRVYFEIALRDLAKHCGFELVEMPWFSHGPSGTVSEGSGSALWTVYDSDGKPTNGFMVHFKEATLPV